MRRLLAELVSQLRREGFNDPNIPLYEHPIPLGGVEEINLIQVLSLNPSTWPEKVVMEVIYSHPGTRRVLESVGCTLLEAIPAEARNFNQFGSCGRGREICTPFISSDKRGLSVLEVSGLTFRLVSKPFEMPTKRRGAYVFSLKLGSNTHTKLHGLSFFSADILEGYENENKNLS